ncbi:MAG: hypothetical protein IT364_19365 [Candidatus Hydrogenedentes bacterium]|nr:hypothetical protein [Candidatus Hydrogenedentota bacterium]
MSNAENEQAEQGQVIPTPPRKADNSVLVKGCAIGCGALIFLAILIGGAVLFFLYPAFSSKMAQAVSKQVTANFETLMESGKVPEQDAELYQSLVDSTQDPEVTMVGAILAATIVETNLEDGEVSDGERQEAQDARALFEANPGAGVFDVNAFIAEHDGLEERIKEKQRSINPSMLVEPQ